MTTAIEELAGNVLETGFEAFSAENVAEAKNRIIDVVGCAIGGANASGNSILIDLVTGWGGKKEATILVHGHRVPAHNAAMVNSIMCRSYDYEVTGPQPEGEAEHSKTGHICGTTEHAALTVAEMKGSNGKELIAAVILGGDMAARVASAEDFDYDRSFNLSGTVNAFGAAAIAGRLWGLNQKQMLSAFGILLHEIAGSYQGHWDGDHTFKLSQGLSARNAIVAVELASKGFIGNKDALLSRRGYFAQYCKTYHPELLTKELGQVFYTRGKHKAYPCCYGNHTAIECCLQLLRQNDIHSMNPEDVAEVILGVTANTCDRYLNQPFEMGDPQMRATFSLPYNVANVLLRGRTRLEHFTDEFLYDPGVLGLVQKVKLVPTTPPGKGLATDLKVKMKDGREFSAHVDGPRGLRDDPLTQDEITDKFWANVDFSKTVSRKKAEKALAMLENLEEIDTVGKIVQLLAA
ncbi:MmgE/PrpD family protein [Chloroflexota bacterium]